VQLLNLNSALLYYLSGKSLVCGWGLGRCVWVCVGEGQLQLLHLIRVLLRCLSGEGKGSFLALRAWGKVSIEVMLRQQGFEQRAAGFHTVSFCTGSLCFMLCGSEQ
jgi:hypothetical protein